MTGGPALTLRWFHAREFTHRRPSETDRSGKDSCEAAFASCVGQQSMLLRKLIAKLMIIHQSTDRPLPPHKSDVGFECVHLANSRPGPPCFLLSWFAELDSPPTGNQRSGWYESP